MNIACRTEASQRVLTETCDIKAFVNLNVNLLISEHDGQVNHKIYKSQRITESQSHSECFMWGKALF